MDPQNLSDLPLVAFGFVPQAAGDATKVRGCSATRIAATVTVITLQQALPAEGYTSVFTQQGTAYNPGISWSVQDISDTVKHVTSKDTTDGTAKDIPFSFEFRKLQLL